MKRNLIPKVMLTCPTSDRHSHLLDEWIEHLNSLTYPNFDVVLIDNSEKDDYFKLLQTKKVKGKKITVLRHKWDRKKWHPVQMLAHAREKARQYFLKRDYDFMMNLDDDVFLPKNGIQKLAGANKDCVGFYVHVYYKPTRRPCLLKSGDIDMSKGLDFYKFSEINEYKKFVRKFKANNLTLQEKNLSTFIIKDIWRPNLFKTYGVGIGCLLIRKNVLEEVPFRTHDSFINGEDLWFFAEANEKHFEFFCDTDVRCRHENTEWHSIITQSPKQMNFWLAHGLSNATEEVIIKRGKRKNG